jgi:hypothetical protein
MNQASQAGRHARAQQRVKQKDSAVHPANLLTLVLKVRCADPLSNAQCQRLKLYK